MTCISLTCTSVKIYKKLSQSAYKLLTRFQLSDVCTVMETTLFSPREFILKEVLNLFLYVKCYLTIVYVFFNHSGNVEILR